MEGEHPNPEHQPQPDTPRIYVASLADYNDGRLHGQWIDATQPADDIATGIDDMLAASPMPDAEEWAIHDYEGFNAFRPSEYEDIATVARVAAGIAEYGPAFAHWVSHVGTTDTDALDDFESHYLGYWESIEEYAQHLLADLGVEIDRLVPDWIAPYVTIDYTALGNDLATDLYVSQDRGDTLIFEP